MTPKPTQPFTARIIENLDKQIGLAQSDSERNLLYARKSFVLARHSLVAPARDLIRELRRINANYQDTRLSAWVMFAEGVIEYSDSMHLPKSKDRTFRAYLIAQVVNDPALAGTAAAWLAFFTWIEGKYSESRDYLAKAFQWTPKGETEARSRANMVFGMAFYFGGQLERARHWMQLARNQAVNSGDIAMQNIILFNSAAFQTTQVCLLDCVGKLEAKELQFAVMSSQSAGNLNTALGISNQPSMVPVQRAELLTVQQKWEEALSLFDAHIESSVLEGQAQWAGKFYAHRAWCGANLGDYASCRRDIEMALNEANQPRDPDDLAILHYRIAACGDMLKDEELKAFHRAMADRCLEKLKEDQQFVNEKFGSLADSLHEK